MQVSSFSSNIHPLVLKSIPSIIIMTVAKWWSLILLFLLHLLVGPFSAPFNLIIYLCRYGFMESIFSQWLYPITFVVMMLKYLASRNLFKLALGSFLSHAHYSWITSLLSDTQVVSDLFLLPHLQSWVSPSSLDSFSWRMILRNQGWGTRDTHCYHNVLCHCL